MKILLLFCLLLHVTAEEDGEFDGVPCAVWATSSRQIWVYKEYGVNDTIGQPWTYSQLDCGNNIWGDELDCVGDWGQKWEEECPHCDTNSVQYPVECSDKCKTSGDCYYRINGDDKNCKAEDYNLGRCQTRGAEGLAGGALALVLILVGLCTGLTVYGAYRAYRYYNIIENRENRVIY